MQNGLKELPVDAAAEDFEVFELPAEKAVETIVETSMQKFIVKLARHNTCPVKQDIVEAVSEDAALKAFARKHGANMAGAQVTVADSGARVRKVRGGN